MDDEKIIELYFSRNEKAIYETDKKYGKYCYSIAFNILGSRPDCEEVQNDTYLGVWNCVPPQRPSVFSAFIGKIARRLSIDRLRKQNSRKRGSGEHAAVLDELAECIGDEKSNTESIIETNMLTEIINSFLESLPLTERKVFMCRYWYLDSVKSISKQFGFSESKVKSMLFRTRNKLRTILCEEGFSV